MYRTNMLYTTGSRPAARQGEERSRRDLIDHPARLRAIPNNAILQQMGFLANTLYGIGGAASKDPEMFTVMYEHSLRFRCALEFVSAALELSDLDVLRAYAGIFDPGLWLTNSGRARKTTRVRALRELAELTERIQRHDKVARVIRRLQSDHLLLLELMQPAESPRRQRLILLHALKVAMIQRIALLATAIPPFSLQQGVTREEIMARLLELDVPAAIELLTRIFPIQETGLDHGGDYGEQSSYHHETALSYAVEHQTVFQPIDRLYEIVRLIGSALNHEIGAMG